MSYKKSFSGVKGFITTQPTWGISKIQVIFITCLSINDAKILDSNVRKIRKLKPHKQFETIIKALQLDDVYVTDDILGKSFF